MASEEAFRPSSRTQRDEVAPRIHRSASRREAPATPRPEAHATPRREAPAASRYARSEYGRNPRSSNGSHSHTQTEDAGTPTPRASRADYTRRRSRKRQRTLVLALSVVGVLVLGGVGAALVYYGVLSGNLHAGVDDDLRAALMETDLANEPFYLLLMGTDASNERDASGDYGNSYRSDSVILARIDPVDKKVTMVSVHRDTLVDMGEYGQNKLNSAHMFGGAGLMVETVSNLAGVGISHYAEINFDGFRDIVNALGGVEVDVPMTIDDEDAGGHLDAGLQTLNGDQALILCRARHAYDEFGDGDSYRAANQRLVLAAIAKKILAADVGTMASTMQALSQYVTTDLEITDIVGLAQAMQGLDPATDVYSAMEPTTSEYLGGIWYEINNTEEWQAMMARVDQGLPPTEDDVVDEVSGTILATTGSGEINKDSYRAKTVSVLNGNGTAGAGSVAAEQLSPLNLVVETGNANSFDYTSTIVVYGDDALADQAQQIVGLLGAGTATKNDGSYSFNTDFLVVLGTDW